MSEWERRPRLPPTHYLDTRLYTDEGILSEERDKIFSHSWLIACHESELPQRYDYRTFQHPAGPNLVLVRGKDDEVRAFFNICPHRGNVLVHEPAGSARALTCIFHAWTFDCRGNCTGIARGKEGYQDRLGTKDVGLRGVRCQVGFGGFVWVNLDDDAPSLADYIGDALSPLEPHLQEPLQVFHYQKVVVNTNYKLWHDTNSELYHDYMHQAGQGRAMRDGESGSRWVLHGREENMTIHDEGAMRHFYAEWSRRMGRLSSDPFDDREGNHASDAERERSV